MVDAWTVIGEFSNTVQPTPTRFYNLSTDQYRWRDFYCETIVSDTGTIEQNLTISNTTTTDSLIANTITISTLVANNVTGLDNQVLVSNGTTVYWSDVPAAPSDYRLKTNLEPISNSIDLVINTPVYMFNWKKDPDGRKVSGFLAHEVQQVEPESVTGEKDGLKMQTLNHSRLVPILWAAVQDLCKTVNNLQSEVEILKNK